MKRRDFLALAGATLASTSRAWAADRRGVLASDFAYVGRMPFPYIAKDPAGTTYELQNARGLAVELARDRIKVWTAGAKLGIAAAPPQYLFRFTLPLSLNGPIGSPEYFGLPGPIPGGNIWGLYHDGIDRIYYSTQSAYDADPVQQRTLGRALVSGSTLTPDGTFTFASGTTQIGDKQTQGGVLRIPDWFADAYLAGKRLGAGCGGYFSSAINGLASKGPSLYPFDPPASGSTAPIQVGRRLLGNDFLNHDPAQWTRRPGDYIEGCDPLNPIPGLEKPTDAPCPANSTGFGGDLPVDPATGIGWWTWTDWIWQGLTWVDTETQSAPIAVVTLGHGRVYYKDATLKAERARHYLAIYDWRDLAAAAQGLKRASEIQPTWTPIEFPDITYPMPGWRDAPPRMVVGTTWVAPHRLLLIHVRQSTPILWQGAQKAIGTTYAYRLHDDFNLPGVLSPAQRGRTLKEIS